jgi:hypothetical protein
LKIALGSEEGRYAEPVISDKRVLTIFFALKGNN